MSIFKVHVITVEEPSGNYFFQVLEDLFKRCCNRPGTVFKDASIYWWTHKPLHNAVHEPIVWLLPDKKSSKAKKVYNNITIPNHVAGTTKIGDKGTISEIYLDHPALEGSTRQAKMAFHELMHNKLQVGNEMHGSSFGFGLNREMLDLSTIFSCDLDSENINLMSNALAKPVPQGTPFD